MRDQFAASGNAFEVELVASGGGVFEVSIDGELRFSKKALGRFPNDDEVAALTGT